MHEQINLYLLFEATVKESRIYVFISSSGTLTIAMILL